MATMRIKSMRTILAPLSERKAISKLWTDNAIYINCYDCESAIDGICIYELTNNTKKELCPLNNENSSCFQCPLENKINIERKNYLELSSLM